LKTIYMKSADGHTVISMSEENGEPVMPAYLKQAGYEEIDQAEYERIEQSIRDGRSKSSSASLLALLLEAVR